ncbi:DNA-binding barrel domain superfamily [Sesbania bispinosa]|nr:DNA-binding barrel domain superfamily [Sesbania bispinosa]
MGSVKKASSSKPKFRLFYMEYNPTVSFQQLPMLFCNDFIDEVGRKVIFRDPTNNVIHMVVRRMGSTLYFCHGWTLLKDIYDIGEGAWLRFYFQDQDEFHLKVYDREMAQILYPIPPREYKHSLTFLPEDIIPGYVQQNFDNIHYSEKKLTRYTSSCNVLNLPKDLCQRFVGNPNHCVLRDDEGANFPIHLSWSKDNKFAYITKGWKEFCIAKGLKAEQVLRLKINPQESSIIFVKLKF